jgi:hypothetical protein
MGGGGVKNCNNKQHVPAVSRILVQPEDVRTKKLPRGGRRPIKAANTVKPAYNGNPKDESILRVIQVIFWHIYTFLDKHKKKNTPKRKPQIHTARVHHNFSEMYILWGFRFSFLCVMWAKCIIWTHNGEVVSINSHVSSPKILDGFGWHMALASTLKIFWRI